MFTQSAKFKKGFSVLFASLTGSLVLAIGLAILSITIKQITLASAGRESQLAFYSADTGIECALFLDSGGGNVNADGNPICPQGIFGIPDETSLGILPQCGMEAGEYSFNSGTKYKCLDQSFERAPGAPSGNSISAPVLLSGGAGIVRTTLTFKTRGSDNLCFNVTIDKTRKVSGVDEGNIITNIISRGFSTCDITSRNRFERAIKIRY